MQGVPIDICFQTSLSTDFFFLLKILFIFKRGSGLHLIIELTWGDSSMLHIKVVFLHIW